MISQREILPVVTGVLLSFGATTALAYEDDFENPASGWPETTFDPSCNYMRYESGRYVMSKCNDDSAVVASPGVLAPADFILDVDIAFLNTDYNTSYLILFGADAELRERYTLTNVQRPGECPDPPNCLIYQELRFARTSWDDARGQGVTISLLAEAIWTPDALNPYLEANHWQVVRRAGYIHIFRNGLRLHRVYDADLVGERYFGFAVGRYEYFTAHAAFDNLVIEEAPAGSCFTDVECLPGEICEEGVCTSTAPCEGGECGPGQICSWTTGHCLPEVAGHCALTLTPPTPAPGEPFQVVVSPDVAYGHARLEVWDADHLEDYAPTAETPRANGDRLFDLGGLPAGVYGFGYVVDELGAWLCGRRYVAIGSPATPGVDAGPTPDGASPEADGGTTPANGGSGCSCDESLPAGAPAGPVLLTVLFLMGRRRRRRA